jgi:hypothetical protein
MPLPGYLGRDLRFLKFALTGERPQVVAREVSRIVKSVTPEDCSTTVRACGYFDSRDGHKELDYGVWKLRPEDVDDGACLEYAHAGAEEHVDD